MDRNQHKVCSSANSSWCCHNSWNRDGAVWASCPASIGSTASIDLLSCDDVDMEISQLKLDCEPRGNHLCQGSWKSDGVVSGEGTNFGRQRRASDVPCSPSHRRANDRISVNFDWINDGTCRSNGPKAMKTIAHQTVQYQGARTHSAEAKRSECAQTFQVYDVKPMDTLLTSMDFDIFLHDPGSLVDVCLQMFFRLELDTKLGISRSAFTSFVKNVEAKMLQNPYHNWYHVVDVTQTIYCLGLQSGLIQAMSDTECLSMLLAGLCHDLEHPGVTSSFLIKTRSQIAARFGMDPSCLERHHSDTAAKLMSESGLLDNLTPASRAELLTRVEGLILATDMRRHEEYISGMETLIEKGCGMDLLLSDQRTFMAELLMKCADTSNVLRPFSIARRWAVHITEEMFRQGDRERSIGMDVSPLCDRGRQSRVAIQLGFVEFVEPFYCAVGQLLPSLRLMVQQVGHTRDMWRLCESDEALLKGHNNPFPLRPPGSEASCAAPELEF